MVPLSACRGLSGNIIYTWWLVWVGTYAYIPNWDNVSQSGAYTTSAYPLTTLLGAIFYRFSNKILLPGPVVMKLLLLLRGSPAQASGLPESSIVKLILYYLVEHNNPISITEYSAGTSPCHA